MHNVRGLLNEWKTSGWIIGANDTAIAWAIKRCLAFLHRVSIATLNFDRPFKSNVHETICLQLFGFLTINLPSDDSSVTFFHIESNKLIINKRRRTCTILLTLTLLYFFTSRCNFYSIYAYFSYITSLLLFFSTIILLFLIKYYTHRRFLLL